MARESNNSRGGSRSKSDEPKFPTIKLITPPLRMSYPKIFDPDQNDQGKDVWELDALIPPDTRYPRDHKDHGGKLFTDVLLDSLEDVMTKHFGNEDEWPQGRNDYAPKDKLRYLDPKKLPGPGVDEDWQVFRARSYQPVGIVDADKNDVLNKREAYGGRWCRLSLSITVYDQPKSKGPAIYLNNVQLLDNDESFGGRASADQDFDAYDGDGGNSRSRGRDRDDRDRDDRGGRDGGRGRGERSRDDDRSRDRGSSRDDRDGGRDRDRSDDRGGSRDRDDRSARGRDRDEDRGRDRDRGRDDRETDRDRGSSGRGRAREEERDNRDREDRGSRGRDRDEGDRRPSRQEEEGSGRSRGRDRDRDDDRGGRDRDRDDDRGGRDRGRDERPSSRDRGRDRDDDREWN